MNGLTLLLKIIQLVLHQQGFFYDVSNKNDNVSFEGLDTHYH